MQSPSITASQHLQSTSVLPEPIVQNGEDTGSQAYSPSQQLSHEDDQEDFCISKNESELSLITNEQPQSVSNPSSGGMSSLSSNIQTYRTRQPDPRPPAEAKETALKKIASIRATENSQPIVSPEETPLKRIVESQQLSTSSEETPPKQVEESSPTQVSAIETTMKIVKPPATEIQEDSQEDPQETTYKSAFFDYNPVRTQDMLQESRLPGRSLSEQHRNPSEPETLHYQEQALEELNSLGFHHQASTEHHLLSIHTKLVTR